jgi:uncharacterized protein (DUF488 family)
MSETMRDSLVLTVGHSTLTYDAFLSLIRSADITAIADVRSAPYSRHFPHFNRETLRDELKLDGVAYVFLGDLLGGRPREPRFFCDGIADYEKMAEAPSFKEGLNRVVEGAGRYRIALMCSEHNPLDCHRCLLVGRALKARDISIQHLLSSGELRSQANIERDLLAMAPDERLASAYRLRSRKAAYAERTDERERLRAAG